MRYEQLIQIQTEFSDFVGNTVIPLIGQDTIENGRLGFHDVAKLIPDLVIQQKYCELAAKLVNANIDYHRQEDDQEELYESIQGWVTELDELQKVLRQID